MVFDNPLFSILIANYNNGTFFEICYNSILAQTYINWEVIIVDDCSTDDSENIIRKLINEDGRFKLFTNERNNGCGFTKNRCAELASGAICGFVDPDDTITPDALQIMAEAHISNQGAALIHSSFNFCDEELKPILHYDTASSVQVTNRFTNLEGRVNHFATYKNSFYQKTDGINPKLLRAVDQDLYLKLSEIGDFVFINKPLYNYRVHGNGIASANVDKAFYWFLKVIAKAEERRNVNLEEEVGLFLNRTNPRNLATNLNNPRYLLLKMLEAYRAKPIGFMKKLFLGKT
jgi:glycosyltransferase involved in cell wall biosynthesis